MFYASNSRCERLKYFILFGKRSGRMRLLPNILNSFAIEFRELKRVVAGLW